jgi:hypothetical protein
MRTVKSLSHPLLLISAALLLDVSGAAAADSANDAEQQMRQVLAGRFETQSPPPYGRRDEGVGQPATDAREYAARLLLGGTTREQGTHPNPQSQSVAVPAPLASKVRWRGDARALARQVVLGQQSRCLTEIVIGPQRFPCH